MRKVTEFQPQLLQRVADMCNNEQEDRHLPKSCVSANFTTRPTYLLSNTYVCIRMLLLDVFASVCAIISAEQTS